MAADTAQQAYDIIVAHINQQQGWTFSSWYCGIASDPESTLFSRHSVSRQGGLYISRPCISDQDARAVEKELIKGGCDGGEGGGDQNSIHVYAYLKTPTTNP